MLTKLFNIAYQNNKLDIFKKHVYKKGLHKILERLQNHPSDVTYFRVLLIIENYLIN